MGEALPAAIADDVQGVVFEIPVETVINAATSLLALPPLSCTITKPLQPLNPELLFSPIEGCIVSIAREKPIH